MPEITLTQYEDTVKKYLDALDVIRTLEAELKEAEKVPAPKPPQHVLEWSVYQDYLKACEEHTANIQKIKDAIHQKRCNVDSLHRWMTEYIPKNIWFAFGNYAVRANKIDASIQHQSRTDLLIEDFAGIKWFFDLPTDPSDVYDEFLSGDTAHA